MIHFESVAVKIARGLAGLLGVGRGHRNMFRAFRPDLSSLAAESVAAISFRALPCIPWLIFIRVYSRVSTLRSRATAEDGFAVLMLCGRVKKPQRAFFKAGCDCWDSSVESIAVFALDAFGRAGDAAHPLRFFAFAAVDLRGLLVVAVPLDIADQAFLFAHLLKPLDHLLDTLTGS